MLAKIKQTLSSKALTSEDMLVALNREFLPVLRMVRDAINNAIGEDFAQELSYDTFQPSITSTAYADVDAPATSQFGFQYFEDDFPSEQAGRTLAFYFRVSGGQQGGTSSSVSFQLYDATAGAAVDGTEFTTERISGVEDSGMLGPITLTDGHLYVVQGKRADGTAAAVVASAQVVARYE